MRLSRREGLAGLVGFAALGGVGAARGQAADPGLLQGTYRSRNSDRLVLARRPTDRNGPMFGATVMLLHGSGGFRSNLSLFLPEAERLATLGYFVVLPDYFSDSANAAMSDDTDWWREAVVDAANWTASLPEVDPQRIGALGYSRGGYLAAEVAVVETTIKAVVGVASAGNVNRENIRRRPSVMLIHAAHDPVIPPRRTRRWARILQEAGVPVETVVLDASRHVFRDDEWRHIYDTADAFFRRTLTAS